jgi:hypothetical protein
MLSKLRRPSPATVIATAAFVVATSGIAIGAIPGKDGKITACYAKDDGATRLIDAKKKCRKGEKRIAWNQRGRAGRTGAAGTNGVNGTNGANGVPAASMLTGSVNTTVTGSGQAFAAPTGRTDPTSSPEAGHVMLSPGATIVARDLAVKLAASAPDPGAAVFTFIVRDDGADTAVSCSITGTARSCNSGAASAQIAAGSELSLRHTQTGTPDGLAREFLFGWRATTP